MDYGARRIGMKGIRILAGLAITAALSLVVIGPGAVAQTPATGTPAAGGQGQDAAKPAYTMAEYNAFTAAQAIKDPAQQVKALDDFVSKYPNSALLIYVYPLYYNA